MSIDKSIKLLVNDIQSTREFKNLKEAKNNLDKFKDVKRDMEALQNRQKKLYSTKHSSKELEAEIKALSNEYKRLSSKAEVMNMIKAGEAFNKLMNRIYLDISKLLDSEL